MRHKNAQETSKFIPSDMTKFTILIALLMANRKKTDAFYWLKSDRLTFQIFCSRSLRQYRIYYKFLVSVRLLTIKISQ